jgi:signal transduction histidine kinase
LLSGSKNSLVFIAESKKEYLTELNQLKLILLTGWLVSLVIIFVTGRYFAGKALQPISKVVKEVDTISISNLHNRVSEGNGQDEIAQLAKTFNRLLERLEIAFQLQRNFVSNASHELRTPLSTITAQLEVTLLNKRTTAEYELVLNSVLDDIRDLNQLSEGLFDLTLASRDVSLMKFANVRMDELLLQARKELLKRKKDYTINIHFGEFPEEETALTLFGKEHLLKSVVINLMDNACKFSGNKTADVFLDIETNTIKLTVSDSGIGMPDEYLNNIFKPLLRAENAKRIPGHGLGLALAKRIVELHHGDIQISTTLNKGTTISLKFPSL